MKKVVSIVFILILISGCNSKGKIINSGKNPGVNQQLVQDVVSGKSNQNETDVIQAPADEFFARITKKPFSIYISPKISPVQPEKFSGYHTGADAEYADVGGDVDVFGVADGTVVYSGFVNGYGGLIIIRQDDGYSSLYGHLKITSLIKKGADVKRGDKIAELGESFSQDTDGERKHLHFAVYKGDGLNFKGYVQNKKDLAGWQDPVDYLKSFNVRL